MHALILETGRRVAPFDDPPDLAQLGTGTLRDAMRHALAKRGFSYQRVNVGEPVALPAGPCLVLADHCFASDKCLGDFLALAFGQSAPQRLALCETPSSRYTLPVSSASREAFDELGLGARPRKSGAHDLAASARIAYDCFFVPEGQRLQAALAGPQSPAALLEVLRAQAERCVVNKREIVRDIRMPLVGDPAHAHLAYPITSTIAAHVEHWVHVLWLNHVAFGFCWGELIRAHKLWALWRALGALTSLPPSLPNLLRRLVWRGKNVRIHPTAHVEASILGDGVVIGPRASVRNSILGAGVEVGDHATVLASTLGAGAYVTPKTFFVWSTAYEGAVLSNYKLQMSVLGRGASSSTWAGLIDAKFQGTIDVLHEGALRSTERAFLGSALGHGTYLGAKVLLLPGRAVPNDTFIAMRPDELIRTIPDTLVPGVPYVRHEGTLVPLEGLAQRATPAAVGTETPLPKVPT